MQMIFLSIMEKLKIQIKINKIVESGDYYFTGSFARYETVNPLTLKKIK